MGLYVVFNSIGNLPLDEVEFLHTDYVFCLIVNADINLAAIGVVEESDHRFFEIVRHLRLVFDSVSFFKKFKRHVFAREIAFSNRL